MAADATYDRIGKNYDETRKPDPFILQCLRERLKPTQTGRYLDVACGSGNYTSQMASIGNWTGIDRSGVMLSKAAGKTSEVSWVKTDVGSLPFAGSTFDAAMCTLAIHHFSSLERAFSEIHRVIGEGRFVLFTSTTEQMKGYWLREYFPEALKLSWEQMPSFADITDALSEAGFGKIVDDPYFVSPDLTDHFLYSGKHRAEMYLDPRFRRGISTFSSLADPKEIEKGCIKLSQDISTNKINEVIESYSNDLGDYRFIIAE